MDSDAPVAAHSKIEGSSIETRFTDFEITRGTTR